MDVLPIGPLAGAAPLEPSLGAVAARPAAPPTASFSSMLLDGVAAVDAKLVQADAAVHSFTLDGSIPIHQVTFALEEARLALELMMQVRSRLVEGYQRVMDMQL